MTTQTEQKKCDNCSEFGECCQPQPEQSTTCGEPVACDSEMKSQAKQAYPHDEKRELAFIDGWLSREATQHQNPATTDWGAVHNKLMDVWYRELSADEGLNEIQDLINTTPYVAICGSTTAPRPQRPSRSDIKPLTDEQIMDITMNKPFDCCIGFARAIEAAHGIKE